MNQGSRARKQARYAEKTLLFIGLIFIFSSSSVRRIEEFKYLTDYMFNYGGVFIIIATLSLLVKSDMFMDNTLKLFTYLYGGFISFIMLSIIFNQSLEVEIYTLEKFVLVFIFLGISLTLNDLVNEKLIINSLMISSVIIFIYFLIEYPVSEITAEDAYSGGFNNSNTFGLVAVTFFSASLIGGTSLLKARRNYPLAILYLLIAIGVGYLTMISNSRTSFITLIVILMIVSVTFTYDTLKTRNLLSWKTVLIIILFAFGLTSLFILIDNPIYGAFESNILDKFTKKIEASGITAGRVDIWLAIIENASFFGESGYFDEIRYYHAHNSFLEILIYYGWFAGIVYLLFWIVMFIKSIQYYLTEKLTNAYALLPLVAISNFILLSMTELVQFHVSTFFAISMVAILSKPKEKSLRF